MTIERNKFDPIAIIFKISLLVNYQRNYGKSWAFIAQTVNDLSVRICSRVPEKNKCTMYNIGQPWECSLSLQELRE